jgi:hypothetical protein
VAARLLVAAPARRPSFLAADLDGLLVPHPAPAVGPEGAWRCGGWRVRPSVEPGGLLRLDLDGRGEDLDALRALCAAAWQYEDARRAAGRGRTAWAGRRGGDAPEVVDAEVAPLVTAHGPAGGELLARWGLR